MLINRSFRSLLIAAVLSCFLSSTLALGQWTKQAPKTEVTEASVREILTALASDSMNGRGSASPDELKAAQYIGERLKAYGIEPAGDNGSYLQSAKFTRRSRDPKQPGAEAT